MNNPVAGATIASALIFSHPGISNPFLVDLISSNEDALGEVVPIPTAPVDGKVFCA
jgi:hypothetical protein